jgi:hypothetical protein
MILGQLFPCACQYLSGLFNLVYGLFPVVQKGFFQGIKPVPGLLPFQQTPSDII